MSHDQVDVEPILTHKDDSTIQNPDKRSSTTTTTTTDPKEDSNGADRSGEPSFFLVPWRGSTFIIRSVSSGHLIALLEGQIVLTQPGVAGASIHWACVENNGWLGFRNISSGKFLGYDEKGRLYCVADRHDLWEFFYARMKPEGGCVLLMMHEMKLWHAEMALSEQGTETLIVGEGAAEGIAWEFIKA